MVAFIIIAPVYLFSQTTQWRLIWDKNFESDMSHYEVYRDTKPSASSLLTTVNHTARTGSDTLMVHIDTQLQRGIRYYYRLKAVSTTGLSSDFSTEVSAAIPRIMFPDSIKIILLRANSSLSFDLDVYVTDPDNADSELEWSLSGAQLLTISIQNTTHVLTITSPEDWQGHEKITLQAEDADGFNDKSTIDIFSDSTQITIPEEDIIVYPVPYIEKQHFNLGGIIFDNIPDHSELLIYTLLGESVYKRNELSGSYTWNVKNLEDKSLSSGIYIYKILNNNKKVKSGKIVIVQ